MTQPRRCPPCGTEIGPALKRCPSCAWLVHGERLKQLSQEARSAASDDRLIDALQAWREALDLLPEDAAQYQVIKNEASRISEKIASTPTVKLKQGTKAQAPHKAADRAGGLGAVVIIALKFKTLIFLFISKIKLLVLGLGKGATLLSMVASLGAYSAVQGVKLAAGLIVGIYVHEMGHVWMMQRFGMRLSAPLFVPGLGAFVQLKQRPLNGTEDARIGMAGPIWGTAFVLICYSAYLVHGDLYWGQLTHVLAWITIFNLVPIWQLDGSRAFQGFSGTGRLAILLGTAAAWAWTKEGLLALLGFMILARQSDSDMPKKTDGLAFFSYAVVFAASCVLSHITPGLTSLPK